VTGSNTKCKTYGHEHQDRHTRSRTLLERICIIHTVPKWKFISHGCSHLGLERVKALKPSGRHRHCSGMACLKESVACGRQPSIRRQRNLVRVCCVLDLTEERWFLSKADAPLLYTLLRLGPQPWSQLRLRLRHKKFGSVVALPIIIFLGFSLFWILNIYPIFMRFTSLSHVFQVFRSSLKDHRQQTIYVPSVMFLFL
jgi:hypothetical protein